MFTNTYLPHVGGVARSITTFEEDLLDEGHKVQIIAPTFPDQEEDDPDNVIRVPAIQNFNGSDFSVRIPLAGDISEKITAFDPDIVHSHHPFLLGDSAVRISRLQGLPLVFTHHTLYEQYTHYVPLDSPALKNFVSDLATQYANICNHVIAPSSGVKELIYQRGVKSPIDVLPTGIDIDRFASGDGRQFRQRHDIDLDTPVIGHVGRLADEKNLCYLARAVAQTARSIPELNFLVAGTGDAQEEIVKIFSQHGVENSLLMVGTISGNDLMDCYAAMDIFVFASQSETQGLVLAEAMAASVPVVALSATGVDDVVENDVNGILLNSTASEEEFSDALRALLTDSKKILQLRRGCSETVKQFSRHTSCERLIELYEEVINEDTQPFTPELDIIDSVMQSIKTEWELLQQKTAAALNSISES
jgi:glycosyltransferase involved in cell wall biosynthesis